LGDTPYRMVHFRIDHFLKFQNPTVTSTSYYKLPKVKIFKSKKLKSWMATIWLVEDLFHYKHPFLLPDLFRRKISKDPFDVTFEVFKIYSSVSIEKNF
jgi:hypothetical protein